MILLLAFRNLFRQKKNSFLLIMLISFITSVFFFGNSLISMFDSGLKRTYIENLTADLMVQKTADVSMNLFGANTPVIDEYFTIPILPAYNDVLDLLSDDPDIQQLTSLVSGKAVMDVNGLRMATPLLGVDPKTYFTIFHGLILESGDFLNIQEHGIMLTQAKFNEIERKSGKSLSIGQPIKLTMASGSSFKIREVPLRGIFSYDNPGPYMEEVIFVDPQTLRALSSVLTVASENIELANDATELLGEDLDDLFSDESLFGEDESEFSIDGLMDELSAGDNPQATDWLGGDWNFILMRIKDGADPAKVKKELNKLVNEYGVTVVDWRTAAGTMAIMVLFIQYMFYGGILLICTAGIISIVNIILISVFKRSKEIGTLRAIGASDTYILSLLFLENICLSLSAGLFGIIGSYLVLTIVNSQKFALNNPLLSALFGQTQLNIAFLPQVAFQSVLLAVLLGFSSSLFPGWKAVQINPIEAVRRG